MSVSAASHTLCSGGNAEVPTAARRRYADGLSVVGTIGCHVLGDSVVDDT